MPAWVVEKDPEHTAGCEPCCPRWTRWERTGETQQENELVKTQRPERRAAKMRVRQRGGGVPTVAWSLVVFPVWLLWSLTCLLQQVQTPRHEGRRALPWTRPLGVAVRVPCGCRSGHWARCAHGQPVTVCRERASCSFVRRRGDREVTAGKPGKEEVAGLARPDALCPGRCPCGPALCPVVISQWVSPAQLQNTEEGGS